MRKALAGLVLVLLLAAIAGAGDFRFVLIRQTANPAGWSQGQDIPAQTSGRMHVELTDANGERTLRDAGCANLLRTYQDMRSGQFGRAAGIVRDLATADVYIYLIDDRSGLTDVMVDYVGPATYNSEAGERNRLYVWPSANAEPERAIKIGEHYLTEALAGGGESWTTWQGTILHELVHTSDQTMWTPVTVQVQASGASEWRTVDVGSAAGAYGRDEEHYATEILPNARAAFQEGIANFVGFAWSDEMRNYYIPLVTNRGMLMVEHGSAVQVLIGGRPAESRDLDGTTYDYYRWDSLPFTALVRNEIFVAMLLYYYALYIPPMADSGGAASGLQQVLHHYSITNQPDRTVLHVIHSLLESARFEDSFLLTRHRYFILGVIDVLCTFNVTKDQMRNYLSNVTFMSSQPLEELLNEYYGTDALPGERETIRGLITPVALDLNESIVQIARHYDMTLYSYYQ